MGDWGREEEGGRRKEREVDSRSDPDTHAAPDRIRFRVSDDVPDDVSQHIGMFVSLCSCLEADTEQLNTSYILFYSCFIT
jgi:hypothetical protein